MHKNFPIFIFVVVRPSAVYAHMQLSSMPICRHLIVCRVSTVVRVAPHPRATTLNAHLLLFDWPPHVHHLNRAVVHHQVESLTIAVYSSHAWSNSAIRPALSEFIIRRPISHRIYHSSFSVVADDPLASVITSGLLRRWREQGIERE